MRNDYELDVESDGVVCTAKCEAARGAACKDMLIHGTVGAARTEGGNDRCCRGWSEPSGAILCQALMLSTVPGAGMLMIRWQGA